MRMMVLLMTYLSSSVEKQNRNECQNQNLLALSLIKSCLVLSSKHRDNPRKLMTTPSLNSTEQGTLYPR